MRKGEKAKCLAHMKEQSIPYAVECHQIDSRRETLEKKVGQMEWRKDRSCEGDCWIMIDCSKESSLAAP